MVEILCMCLIAHMRKKYGWCMSLEACVYVFDRCVGIQTVELSASDIIMHIFDCKQQKEILLKHLF